MLRRSISLSAAIAAASVIAVSAFASNGGAVGNVVDAGENIVNDVVDAGESVVDDVTDAVTGDNNGTTGGNVGSAAGGNTTGGNTGNDTNGTTNGTTGGNTTGTTNTPDNETSDIVVDNAPTNPVTGVPFAYAAVAALALGGVGMAVSARKDD